MGEDQTGATGDPGSTDQGAIDAKAAAELLASFKEAGIDDPKGALDTIRKLRVYEKGEKLPATVQKELEELRAKVAEADNAKLSETEKLTKTLAASEAKTSELELEVQQLRLRSHVTEAAREAGAIAPTQVWKLIEPTEVNYDASGEPTNVPELLDELRKAEPGLFSGRAGSFDQGARTSGSPDVSMNDMIRKAAGRL